MKIKIHDSTYVFLLLSFLAGYFQYMYILLLVIIVHEFGHFLFGLLEGIKLSKIIIYPFGGITIYDEDLNLNSNKELICLLGGIVFQILFYLIINKLHSIGLVTNNIFIVFNRINILLILFNFMPILPLDGGRLLNILLDKIFSYKLSNIISIIISSIFSIIFLIYNWTLFSLLLFIFLMKNIVLEIMHLKMKYNKFLLERYLNNYVFKKIKIINNINNFKRDYYHIINNTFERKYLSKLFDRNT